MKPYKLPKNYLDFGAFQKHQNLLTHIQSRPISIYNNPSANNLAWMFEEWGKGYPLYCVRKSLLEDIAGTDVGENLPLFETIELAIPCYALFFPKQSVESPSLGAFINYLIVHYQELDYEEHKYLISWGGLDSSENMILSYKRIRRDGTIQYSAWSSDDEEQQQKVLNIRNIVLQSLLLLQFYPELGKDFADSFSPRREKGFSKSLSFESHYQLPRWLGEKKVEVRNFCKTKMAQGQKNQPIIDAGVGESLKIKLFELKELG